MRAHHVDADGTRLHVEEHGEQGADRPVVLFGHSLLCDNTMFGPQVADLARDHRVLNLDFRGHGRSGVPDRPYTMEDQGQDYGRVLDALGVKRAAIVGLSMGGMAGMRFALASPDRVSALVLMNTSGDGETRFNRIQYGLMAETFARFGAVGFIVKEVTRKMFGRTFRQERAPEVERWTTVLKGLDRQGGRRAVHMVRTRGDIRDHVSAIACPTLVIAGEEDAATPPANARLLADRIPGARLEVLPRTGHLSTIEQPEATTRLIRVFLEEHGL